MWKALMDLTVGPADGLEFAYTSACIGIEFLAPTHSDNERDRDRDRRRREERVMRSRQITGIVQNQTNPE